MRVIQVPKYGGPEVLDITHVPDPDPAPGKVRVQMRATGVNPADLLIREGVFAARTPDLPFPFVLGFEIAGTVLDDAEGFTKGQRVIGLLPWLRKGDGEGTNAEIVRADREWLAPLPEGIDWVTAATIPLNALTARQAIDLLDARPGDTVLITGASGAVGGFAVQIAAADGLNVIATASEGDEDYVASLGAKQVLKRGETAPVDHAFDPALIGQPLLAAIKDGGTYVAATDPAMPPSERGINVTVVHSAPDPEALKKLVHLRTRVAAVFPIEQVKEAHERVKAGGFRGKVVLGF